MRDEPDGPAGLGDGQPERQRGKRPAVGGGDPGGGGQQLPGRGGPGADGHLDGGLQGARGSPGSRDPLRFVRLVRFVVLGGVRAQDARVRVLTPAPSTVTWSGPAGRSLLIRTRTTCAGVSGGPANRAGVVTAVTEIPLSISTHFPVTSHN
ncbi:hypothetical protein WKI68_13555 [Streptomyces sp. MS1.HAVA.3]|uniref:Uncharacterized protein n=1 Tax=Streptomyces caledonius TaxID=3134107 RepID=A0ABU8U2V5_9ACTN